MRPLHDLQVSLKDQLSMKGLETAMGNYIRVMNLLLLIYQEMSHGLTNTLTAMHPLWGAFMNRL